METTTDAPTIRKQQPRLPNVLREIRINALFALILLVWLPLVAGVFLIQNWRWLLRGALLWGSLALIAPPGPRAVLGPQQQVQTHSPQLCVHTRLIDEVFEWKIQRSLQLVREMGADHIVEFFPWAYIEGQRGRYDWSQADKIMRHAQNQGLHVIARMGFVPAWAQGDSGFATLNDLREDAYPDFADFVATFAARYAGVVDHLIIWNEPNLAFEWGYREVAPARYLRLLQAVYDPVKQANPDVNILGAALAPTLEPAGSPHGLNDLHYLEQLLALGAADYMDGLAVHTYGFNHPPEADPAPDRLNFRRVELLHAQWQAVAGDAPVYITESGWNDHPRWTLAVRPSQRVQYTVDALRYAEAYWPWLNQLCFWAFRYPAPTHSYPDHFTFVTPDFTIKPIYYALQAHARQTSNIEDTLWLPPPAPAS